MNYENKCKLNNAEGMAEPIGYEPCINDKVINLEEMAAALRRSIENLEKKLLGPKVEGKSYDQCNNPPISRTISNTLDEIKVDLNAVKNILVNISGRVY